MTFRTQAVHAIALAAILAGAFWLRVVPPAPAVFRDGRVLLLSNDPWIHAHEVDDILTHFPRVDTVDPHRLHPGGQATGAPLFPWTLAATAWALGGGGPSRALVDRVLAYAPAVLGALIVWVVYLLGRRLFGSACGLLAAALTAVLPGQLLQRSLLGYTDHHVAECLLSLLTLAAFAAALDAEPARRHRHALVAGVVLGAYLLTWARGVLLPMALLVWALLQIVREHRAASAPAGSRDTVATLITWAFGIAFLMTLPFAARPESWIAMPVLVVGVAAVLTLARTSAVFERHAWGRARLLFACAAAALVAIALVRIAAPDWVDEFLALPRRLATSATSATIAEARPLLWLTGSFSLAPLWAELTTSAPLGLAGLALLVRRAWREARPADTLLVVWTLVATALTLAQARFGYYLAPAAALASAWAIVTLCRGLAPAFSIAAAVGLALYPAWRPALAAAGAPDPGPSHAWVEALDWLRTSTSDPWRTGERYGILAWCDAGYWITRLGERAPIANPTQHGATEVAAFLLESDEAAARRRLQVLGARYLILDRSLLPEPHGTSGPVWLGKLDTLARWANRRPSDFYEILLEPDATGTPRATVVYTPAYYQSMLVRLYAFGGHAVRPRDASWVIETEPAAADAQPARPRLLSTRRFARYEEAMAFLATQPRARLVGRDPFDACLPLEELPGYAARHSSAEARLVGVRSLPEVAVFEATSQ